MKNRKENLLGSGGLQQHSPPALHAECRVPTYFQVGVGKVPCLKPWRASAGHSTVLSEIEPSWTDSQNAAS